MFKHNKILYQLPYNIFSIESLKGNKSFFPMFILGNYLCIVSSIEILWRLYKKKCDDIIICFQIRGPKLGH